MSVAAPDPRRGRPRLRLVRGAFWPPAQTPWRRAAAAVLACTQELSRHLLERRWVRVDEALRERRELLAGLERLPLDAEASRCIRALRQAAAESEHTVQRILNAPEAR